jgi:hypothetical protein
MQPEVKNVVRASVPVSFTFSYANLDRRVETRATQRQPERHSLYLHGRVGPEGQHSGFRDQTGLQGPGQPDSQVAQGHREGPQGEGLTLSRN